MPDRLLDSPLPIVVAPMAGGPSTRSSPARSHPQDPSRSSPAATRPSKRWRQRSISSDRWGSPSGSTCLSPATTRSTSARSPRTPPSLARRRRSSGWSWIRRPSATTRGGREACLAARPPRARGVPHLRAPRSRGHRRAAPDRFAGARDGDDPRGSTPGPIPTATHQRALGDPAFIETVLTRAFTGRPARALRNGFVDRHPEGIVGYPAVHHLTRSLRQAAGAAGDADRLHLWAGTGWRSAPTGPAADVVRHLVGD